METAGTSTVTVLFVTPAGNVASSALAGTPPDQFPAADQLLLAAPVHVFVAAERLLIAPVSTRVIKRSLI